MKRTAVIAPLLALFSVLLMDAFFWSRLGLEAAIGLLGVGLITLITLWPHRRRFSLYTAILFFFHCALSVSLVFSDQGDVKFVVICAILFLYTLFLTDMMAIRRHPSGTWRSGFDWCYTAFPLTFGQIRHGLRILFIRQEGKKRQFGGILLGAVLAFPALLILLPLLISSDAAFEGLVDRFSMENIVELLISILFGLGLFLLLFGRLTALPHTTRGTDTTPEQKGVDSTVIITFLSLISAVYLLYLFSQLAYFFNAFSGLLKEGFSVAEYARRGFFEMTAVCAINLLLLGLSAILCRKQDGKRPIAVTVLLTFVGLFSLLLIAVSLSKMMLYIDSFGLTHLRMYTSLFMLVLAVLFIGILLRLYLPRIPYFKPAVCTAALLLTLLSFADADRLVAAYNVSAYQSGKLDTVDVQALYLESDAVIPYLEQLTHDSDPRIAQEAREVLIGREKPNIYDWRSFNLPSFYYQ